VPKGTGKRDSDDGVLIAAERHALVAIELVERHVKQAAVSRGGGEVGMIR
jgi:hypothetical protein